MPIDIKMGADATKLQEGLATASKYVAEAVGNMRSQFGNLSSMTSRYADEIHRSVSNAMSASSESIKKFAAESKVAASDFAGNAAEKIKGAAQNIKESAQDIGSTAGQHISDLGESASRASGDINVLALGLGSKFMMAGSLVGIALTGVKWAIDAVVEGTKKFRDAADQISQISYVTGLSASAIQDLQSVSKTSGVELNVLQAAVLNLNSALNDTGARGESFRNILEQIGIPMDENSRRSQTYYTLLLQIADKFSSYEDGAGKAKIATELLGSADANLIALLDRGGPALALRAQAWENTHTKMSEAEIKHLEQLKETDRAVNAEADFAAQAQYRTYNKLMEDLSNTFSGNLTSWKQWQTNVESYWSHLTTTIGYYTEKIKGYVSSVPASPLVRSVSGGVGISDQQQDAGGQGAAIPPAKIPPPIVLKVEDFDKTLKELRNQSENILTWTSERTEQYWLDSYNWAVKERNGESELSRQLWDRYADAARAAQVKETGGGAGRDTSVEDARRELNELIAINRERGEDTKQAEHQFWIWKRDEAERGSKLYDFALQEANRLARELGKEETKNSEEEMKKQQQIDALKEESKKEHAQALYNLERERISQQKALGLIDSQQSFDLQRQSENREYQDALQALNRKAALYTQDEVKQQQVYKEIETLTNQHNLRLAQMDTQGINDRISKWKSFFQTITSGFSSAINSMLQGNQSFSNAIKSMWNSMVSNIITKIGEMTIKWAIMEIMKTSTTSENEVARTAAVTAGVIARDGIQDASAASGLATQAATGMKAIFNDAKIAAADSYAWASSWGGPVAGAIAAAVAFAAVMAFGTLTSAAGGWGEVPQDQIALVHKREMILPASIADTVRAMSSMMAAPSFAGLGGYGIPADKLTFTRAALSGGLSFGEAGAATAAAARGRGGDVTVSNPTFNFPSNLADLVKSNPNALYRGIRDGVKKGHISKRNLRR